MKHGKESKTGQTDLQAEKQVWGYNGRYLYLQRITLTS